MFPFLHLTPVHVCGFLRSYGGPDMKLSSRKFSVEVKDHSRRLKSRHLQPFIYFSVQDMHVSDVHSSLFLTLSTQPQRGQKYQTLKSCLFMEKIQMMQKKKMSQMWSMLDNGVCSRGKEKAGVKSGWIYDQIRNSSKSFPGNMKFEYIHERSGRV